VACFLAKLLKSLVFIGSTKKRLGREEDDPPPSERAERASSVLVDFSMIFCS
jgi:hypothetical protein